MQKVNRMMSRTRDDELPNREAVEDDFAGQTSDLTELLNNKYDDGFRNKPLIVGVSSPCLVLHTPVLSATSYTVILCNALTIECTST
jgi:hypothetical protein